MQKTIAQLKTANAATFGNGKDTRGDDEKTFNDDQLDSIKPLEKVVSASQTAVLGESYVVVASATFTDPAPSEGKGFSVFVRNGTATVGGVAYNSAGTTITRIFHSGAWKSYLGTIESYVTLDRTAWDALVAANGLVAGWRYRVTGAYTFDAFGAKDIVVTADSVNTIETTTQVVFGDFYVPYTTDFAFNQGFFLYAYPSMALTGTQSLAYGTYNWKFNSGLTMYLTDGSLFFQTEVQGSDFSTIIFDNVKALDSNGTDWLAGDLGTFDPNTDTFTPNANTWAPTATTDGTVMTGLTGVVSGKYSRVGNVLHYSFLISEGVFDFTAGNTGFVQIADSEFPFLPIGDHVVNASFSEPEVIGSIAINSASLRINFINKSTTLTVTTDISITGQCLL